MNILKIFNISYLHFVGKANLMPVKYTLPSVEASHHSVGVCSIERHTYVVHFVYGIVPLAPSSSLSWKTLRTSHEANEDRHR